MNGELDALTFLARRTLLDALEILDNHRAAVILVGAQAIYLHVGEADHAVAALTKDADLALDTRILTPTPKIEEVLRAAGFDSPPDQIGIWRNQYGGQIDFLVPEALAGGKGRRAAKLGAQGDRLARRTKGLEGALVDSHEMDIASLGGEDTRRYQIRVAGPGALLVAKLHKLGERQTQTDRSNPKDALDVLRLLRGISTEQLADSIQRQMQDASCEPVAAEAVEYLESLFGAETSPGSYLAGKAVEGLDDPAIIRASAAALALDLLLAVRDTR